MPHACLWGASSWGLDPHCLQMGLLSPPHLLLVSQREFLLIVGFVTLSDLHIVNDPSSRHTDFISLAFDLECQEPHAARA